MKADFDVRKVQLRLLGMAKVIASILDAHNIPHMVAFGTLLGAVRHKGFIPWDDDFDFFLFDDSYAQAMTALRSELPNDMFLEDEQSEPRYFHAWAHVKDVNSVCECDLYPRDSIYSHHGISIDLYKVKMMRERELPKYRYNEGIAYIERLRNLGFMEAEEFESKMNSFLDREQKEEEEFKGNGLIFGDVFVDSRMQRISDVMPLKRIVFEDTRFWAPNNPDAILKNNYGNYMALPDESHRIPHYSNVRTFSAGH